MPAAERSVAKPQNDEPQPRSETSGRPWQLRLYEAAVSLPVVAMIGYWMLRNPQQFSDWKILVWMAAIATVDLLPVPTTVSSVAFSLSFPLELSVAMIYATPVAGLIAIVGASDPRELRLNLPFMKALFIRGQIAITVMFESFVFHKIAILRDPAIGQPGSSGWRLGLAVLTAAIIGYVVNLFFVSFYGYFQSGQKPMDVLRQIHVGVFGEFVLSYSGLALFSVLVATTFRQIGPISIFVFIAPLAFARQMFTRTHSLQEATNELARKQAENEHQAMHDALTGMPNRTLFQFKLIDAIDEAKANGGKLAVMLIDLDHFKEINDTLGHHFGDLLLQEIGPRLSSVLRDVDLMARLGGDEFGIVLPDLPDEQVAIRVADRLLEELEQPVQVEGLALDVSGSVGIALFPQQANDAEALLRRADVAMYAAKEHGAGYELYQEEMDRNNPQRLTLIGQVRPALEGSEFTMYYQPKVRLSDGRVAGAEALIRWEHPSLGLVPPDEFIPLVEKTVLLRPLTHYVIEQVLRQWREWADMGIRLPVAINLSARSLLDGELPDQVHDQLRSWDVPPAFLRMELTESFLMSDSGRSTVVLDRLSDVGVGLSIDDFGTGYSSLSYLKRLPIEEIKIDRSFVMQMHVDANDFMIVRATVDLGRNLGLRVVAEGVEDADTFDRLAEFGCDEAQGYYISRPVSAVEFTRWLSVRNLEQEPALGGRMADRPANPSSDGERSDAAAKSRLHVV
jgi:diguanylate cyclase (GGDEF)-like protein